MPILSKFYRFSDLERKSILVKVAILAALFEKMATFGTCKFFKKWLLNHSVDSMMQAISSEYAKQVH